MANPEHDCQPRPNAIAVARVYDAGAPTPGDYCVLVDRMWPRGIARDNASWHEWRRELAPSNGLRQWFGHLPERWPEFRRRYRRELAGEAAALAELARAAAGRRLVLLYAARDRRHNNAQALAIELAQKWHVRKVTPLPKP